MRGGTDLVTVAELLGHTRLDTVRIYTFPPNANATRPWTTSSATADRSESTSVAELTSEPLFPWCELR